MEEIKVYGKIEVKLDKKKGRNNKEEDAIFLRTPNGEWAYATGVLVILLPVLLAKLEDEKYKGTKALGGDYHEETLRHFMALRKFYTITDIQNKVWNDFKNMMKREDSF